ncbi:efflux transporter, outer membrane factor (OMF) lipoprotein, NodT family [Paraburkholderia fungorum]|uniref:Efflux transporter, outer membrane factor (OMF) lipoprotein, NodT family n=1 Tax=Paraburkholderia fungorum TaxID=134537 RepID=A0A1H1JG11_9BURK|nr:efflux transporter outer membrane subunit [Paraburkholderia fungorum]SDR48842.1 efflux transporter, outer membrane factor (OMF) lipoprotein, NodT family [Paraburkholderia fungorum]
MTNFRSWRFFQPTLRRSRRVLRVARLGALASVIAGCTVGPPYREPAVPDAASRPFASTAVAPVSAAPMVDSWWQLYRDPALDALVQQALANNRDLAVAAAHLQRAEAVLNEAGAARLPDTDVALGGNYGKQSTDQIVAAATRQSAATRWAYAPSLAVSWEVDLWGRVRELVASAQADAEATQAARDALRVAIAAETTDAYAHACSFGQQIDVAQRSLAIAERVAQLTQIQRSQGLVSELEVVRAQAFVSDTGATLPDLQGKRRAALYELAVLTGHTPADIPVAASQCHAVPLIATPFPVGDGAALLKRRPDLREAERRLAAASARVGVATAELYPSVVLGGSVDWLSTSGSLASLGNQYAVAWGIGPLISWHFPNMAVSRAKLSQARADSAAELASFDSRVLNALKETEQALTLYGAEWDRHRALQQARAQHARAFELAELNYKAGALDFLDVLDAERGLVTTDAALAASTEVLASDQVAVFKALGGGWQR